MKSRCRASSVMAATILAALLIVPPVFGGEPAPSATGFVAGISGKGFIERNKDTIMISGMDLLYPGDGVRLAKGARARITICGNKGYEIRGLAVFKIRGRGITFSRGRALRTYAVENRTCTAALEVFRKNEKKLPDMVPGGRTGGLMLRSKNKNLRLGVYVVRGRKGRTVIESFSDRLLPEKPYIGWTPVTGRASYRVVISGTGGTLWSDTVPNNSCAYPAGAPPLAEGTAYALTIEALSDRGEVLARGSASISLYNREEAESFRSDEASIMELLSESEPGRHILLGKLYEAHGQMAGALACYEKALALDSGNAGLQERVALLKNLLEMK